MSKMSTERLKNSLDKANDTLKQFRKEFKESEIFQQEELLKSMFKNTLKIMQSIKTQENIINNNINNLSTNVAYELGKLGSIGIRSDCISLTIQPKIHLIHQPVSEMLKYEFNTYQPKFLLYSIEYDEEKKKTSQLFDQTGIYNFQINNKSFIEDTKIDYT